MTIDFNQFDKTTYPYLDDSYIDDYIPVAYGKVAAAKLTCINSNYDTDNGNVAAVYRMPDGTSNYGAAYVYINDTWVAATVASVDYGTELLTISNGRSGSGSTYECKLVDFYGYMFDGHSYARQILQHWCATYGNIQYTDSNFDKTNWESELDDDRFRCDIGFLLDDYAKTATSKDSYDIDYFQKVIFNISQVGGKMFCRIDYTGEKKLTAKLMDYDRASSKVFASCEIKNNGVIPVKSSKDSSACAYILEKYHQNYAESDSDDEKYLSLKDYTYQNYVKRNYRIFKKYTDETYIISQADATTRAANLALMMKDTPKVFTVELPDVDLELYDVITIPLKPNNLDASAREYAGEHDCLVIGINPDFDTGINEVTIEIIPDRTASVSQVAILTGEYTTVSREKSSQQIINDNLQGQITDNLLLTGYLKPQAINVPADSNGIVSDYSKATGTFNVTYNGTDVTGSGPVYSLVSQSDCVGSIDAETGVYSIIQLSADTGVLTLKATYQGKSIESSFVVTKSYAGVDGSSDQISIQCSARVFVRNSDASFNPATITFSGILSSGTTQESYAGRFKIYVDGVLDYTSSADESSTVFTIPDGATQITAYLYESGGTTTQKDICVVPSVTEGTAIEVFIDNTAQGYQVDSSGYLAADYTVTGEVFAYQGATPIKCKIGTLPTVDGFEITKSNNTITIKALSGIYMADAGNITIHVYLLDDNSAVVIGDPATPWVLGDASVPYVIGDFDIDTSRTYNVYFSYWKVYAGTNGTNGADGKVYGISANNTAFTKNRAGGVTPSTITVSAYYTQSDSAKVNYSGRFIIYTSDDGITFTSRYTSAADEQSHAYAIPSNIAAIRIELYASGGTYVLLATSDYPVAFSESVAPEYLGIGLLADVSGLTTKSFTGATVAITGAITVGSTVSNIITGDWMINYTAGTYRRLYIYIWSGTAWESTSAVKYIDSCQTDIFNLAKGGIEISGLTVVQTAIINRLMVSKLTLLTGGQMNSSDYNGDDAGSNNGTKGFRIGHEGNIDANGNTHIGGTLIVDGVATFGSNSTFNGVVQASGYVDGYIINNGVKFRPICSGRFIYLNSTIYPVTYKNISSIVRSSTGLFTVTLTTAVSIEIHGVTFTYDGTSYTRKYNNVMCVGQATDKGFDGTGNRYPLFVRTSDLVRSWTLGTTSPVSVSEFEIMLTDNNNDTLIDPQMAQFMIFETF